MNPRSDRVRGRFGFGDRSTQGAAEKFEACRRVTVQGGRSRKNPLLSRNRSFQQAGGEPSFAHLPASELLPCAGKAKKHAYKQIKDMRTPSTSSATAARWGGRRSAHIRSSVTDPEAKLARPAARSRQRHSTTMRRLGWRR